MAGKTIKGLTVEIGGDTTKLGKALKDVEAKGRDLSRELKDIERLLKMDPGNTELLAQKQKVLGEAAEAAAKKLETLKEAEKQVQEQFEKGEVSEEQLRALQREIIATENKMKGYQKAAQQTGTELEQLGDSADEAGDDAQKAAKQMDELGDEVDELGEEAENTGDGLNNFANKGLKTVGGVAVAAVGALTAAAESTRDYRTEMGKLDTAFTESGFSSQTATEAYTELVGVLGETDQSVEAANHLAKLTDNEKDLATWTGSILPGVFATFGASLPIEGLTEAANETAKTSKLCGSLADALNWAGVSEEQFQASLDKCSSEQERQTLITKTLSDAYSDASASYKATNADVIAANQANDAWMQSLAQTGAAVEPLITQVKEIGAVLLKTLVPVIEFLADNLPAVATALIGVTAAMISFKVAALAATAAENGMTISQYLAAKAQLALNGAMAANPIGMLILAITALVTAFMLLWNNCDGFREFWVNLWEGIKNVVSAVVDWFVQLPGKIWSFLTGAIKKVTEWRVNMVKKAVEMGSKFLSSVVNFFKDLPYKIGYFIGQALGSVARWVTDMVNKAKELGSKFLSGVVNFFKQLPGKIWSFLTNAVSKVISWRSNMINKAKEVGTKFLSNVLSFFKQLPGKIWSFLTSAVQKIVQFGSNAVAKAKAAASKIVNGVVNGIKSLPGKIMQVGKDLVTGLWKGITDKFNWLKNKIKSFAKGVLDGIKSAFGIKSPSRETAWVGEMLDEGLAKGLLDSASTPIQAMQKVTGGVLNAAENVNGLSLERSLQAQTAAAQTAATHSATGMLDKLDKILTAIERGQVLTIDRKALIGATAADYDNTLGQRRALAARGAL